MDIIKCQHYLIYSILIHTRTPLFPPFEKIIESHESTINRVRKQKEAYAITELRRQQNRMQFGVPEEETTVFDSVKGLGMIGNSGKVRAAPNDPRIKGKLYIYIYILTTFWKIQFILV